MKLGAETVSFLIHFPSRDLCVSDIFRPKVQTVPVTLSLEEAYRGTTRKIELAHSTHLGQSKKQIEVTIPQGVGTDSKINIVADGQIHKSLEYTDIITVEYTNINAKLVQTDSMQNYYSKLRNKLKWTGAS